MKDNITDAAIIGTITGLSLATINQVLAMVGLAIAIPVGLCRLYVGWNQAREWHHKRRSGD